MASYYGGMSPSEAQRLGRQIDAAARNAKRDDYDEYAAEARACGYEVESFAEWLGEEDPKAKASDRMDQIDWRDLDLY